MEVSTAELVIGDLVVLSAGSKYSLHPRLHVLTRPRVPADLRIMECVELTVDESMLTGESQSVRKSVDISDDPHVNIAYMVGLLSSLRLSAGVLLAFTPSI
jgi:magnesium-transporting ATPase (P-type)